MTTFDVQFFKVSRTHALGEKEETASPFRLFHSLHLEFERSSRPIRTCEKTLRHWKMYYYDNGHFAINIPICLTSINALAITTTGFDQHRVGKPRELSRETEVLMVIAKSRLVTVSGTTYYINLATSCSVEAW